MNYFLIFLVILLLVFPESAFAGGSIHGARAAGMGSAFIGVADDPSAILHNPGGLTQVRGTQVYGGATGLVIDSEYESPSIGHDQTDFQVFISPHVFFTTDRFGPDSLTLGFGICSPYGIGGRKWDDRGPLRYLSVESAIVTMAANPVAALKVTPNLSLAAGVVLTYARNDANKKMDQSYFSSPDGTIKLKADGWGWSYNLGMLYQIDKHVRFGFAYRSQVKMDLEGEVTIEDITPPMQLLFGGSSFSTDIASPVTFPEIFSVGISFKPVDNLTLDADYELVHWSSFERSIIDFRHEIPAANFTDVDVALDWQDSYLFKLGGEYRTATGLALRAGYAYVSSQVPDQTLEPSSPDSDQHYLCVGLGFKRDSWVFDFFYNIALSKNRTVNNNILSGIYGNSAHFLGFSLGKTFN